MTDLFGNPIKNPFARTHKDNRARRNWENRFQRWSNNQLLEDGTTSYGVCGYGSMCDYCTDNTYGRPCVRALNAYLKENDLTIDYKNAEFTDVWSGNYFEKRGAV